MQPSKVGDFFIGFLGLIAAGFMLGLMTIPLNSVSGPVQDTMTIVISAVSVLLTLAAFIWAIRVGRPYISLGIVAAIALPFLAAAACITVIALSGARL